VVAEHSVTPFPSTDIQQQQQQNVVALLRVFPSGRR